MCLSLDLQLQDDPTVLGSFSPNDLMIRFPSEGLPACPSPEQIKEFGKSRIRAVMPHEYYHSLQLLGTAAGLRRLLFRTDLLKNRIDMLRAIARRNGGVLPFPVRDWISRSPEASRIVGGYLEAKLIYYEGGFDFGINRLSKLTGRTYTGFGGIESVTPLKINGHKFPVSLPVFIRQISGSQHARALGYRDVIEGCAYCVSMLWKRRKDGEESMIAQMESDRDNPEMAIYTSSGIMLSFYIHDEEFRDSDIGSLETLIILGELSLMLDFYMLNINPDLFSESIKGKEETVAYFEKNGGNPACYLTMLISKLGEIWRTIPVPDNPSNVRKFCDLLLGALNPELTLENLIEGLDKTAEFMFGSLSEEILLPLYHKVIIERIQNVLRLRRTLKYPIFGLNMLDNSQLEICYRDNPVPYLVNMTAYDPSPESSPLPECHLLGSLSELHKLTIALESGKSLRCELFPEGSGCLVPRTPFCEGKNIQEIIRECPSPKCIRLLAMSYLAKACEG